MVSGQAVIPMRFPLLFSFQQPVFGKGFLAGVRMDGRALLEQEDGEFWISGVAPIGFAVGNADLGCAFTEFRKAWVAVLFDIANESNSFEEFKDACEKFLGSKAHHITEEWNASLEETRRAQAAVPGLKRERADKPITFVVEDLAAQRHDPKENVLEAGVRAAA
jgi:hypothetical protein